MIDYEDGYGPQRANVAVCGAKLDLYDSVTAVTRSVFGRVYRECRPTLPAGGWSDVRRGHGLPANAVVTVDGVAAAVPTPGPKEARRD